MTIITSVKERPILFSSLMVKAILEGRKTMTRRVVKPQPIYILREKLPPANGLPEGGWFDWQWRGKWLHPFLCPYGQPGNRLWVRETFCYAEVKDRPYGDPRVVYKADMDAVLPELAPNERPKWRPAIHMPRWASRITLEITGVRVERLQEIGEEDALSEGAFFCNHGVEHGGQHYRCGFKSLWQSINGPGSWDANSWVWVIEFKRVEAGQ